MLARWTPEGHRARARKLWTLCDFPEFWGANSTDHATAVPSAFGTDVAEKELTCTQHVPGDGAYTPPGVLSPLFLKWSANLLVETPQASGRGRPDSRARTSLNTRGQKTPVAIKNKQTKQTMLKGGRESCMGKKRQDKIKRQTDWEEILATPSTDKGPIFSIYKERPISKQRKTYHPIGEWGKSTNS